MLMVIYLLLPPAKSEIQNSESENELVWNFALFDHGICFEFSDFVFWIFFSVTRLISAEHFLRSGHHVVRFETKLSLQFF